jgi:tetratricopeptide (TPR) repeat protein
MNSGLVAIYISLLVFIFSCSPYSRPETTPLEKEKAFNYYLKSLDAYQNGEFRQALEQVERAIAINDHFAQFYELQGNIYLALYNETDALEAFYDALRYRSNYTAVLKGIGDIYFSQGKYTDAIQYFNKALGSDNLSYALHLNIADSYLQLGDYTRALFSLKEYQRSIMLYNGTLENRYHALSGEAYFYREEYEKSIVSLKQANPTDHVLYLLGRNYYALKDFDTGITYFNTLMKRNQNEGAWYFYRGIYFYQKDNYVDALGQFKQALLIDPSIYDAHYFMGKIHEMNKEYRAAWESFRLYRESMTDKDELRYLHEKVVLPDELYLID